MALTVKELITYLSKFDDDMEVVVPNGQSHDTGSVMTFDVVTNFPGKNKEQDYVQVNNHGALSIAPVEVAYADWLTDNDGTKQVLAIATPDTLENAQAELLDARNMFDVSGIDYLSVPHAKQWRLLDYGKPVKPKTDPIKELQEKLNSTTDAGEFRNLAKQVPDKYKLVFNDDGTVKLLQDI